ncbi:MAG: class I SAM-dependent methyltransferase [Coleofasciculus sp. B1-GNL1-01]|uniref:class I SAM-dependent methyltransferase n=1 Tax=Coleofasciculus sp. B1-GNL1-01 TaxID=3068484 RepID=UPI0032F8E2A7
MNALFKILSKLNPIKPDNSNYIYRPDVIALSFAAGMASLQKSGWNVVPTAIDNTSPAKVRNILRLAHKAGMKFCDYEINWGNYQKYFNNAEYKTRYPDYYRGNQVEKSLEHYLTLTLLNVSAEDIFIDIASEQSPIPEIYRRLTGATTYSQDIMYPPGIKSNQIGGDACSMPVPNNFASKAALTCSLEHFEADADTRLFDELSRVLKPGGKVCVVPFYLYEQAATQTDPTVSATAGVIFDPDTTLYCAQGWGNRHGRFYSPDSFYQRIIKPVQDRFKFEFYYLQNAADVDPSVYARFAFTATRL